MALVYEKIKLFWMIGGKKNLFEIDLRKEEYVQQCCIMRTFE